MQQDAISIIKDAEERADRIIAEAKEKARAISAEAEKSAAAEKSKIISESRAKAANMEKEGMLLGTEKAELIKNRTKTECEAIEKTAGANLDKSIALIIERVVNA